MGFFVGFADEIEKLALRLPSMGEMTSGFGAEPPPAPSAVTQPAPAPAPQGQSVHVHVHHQAKKTAPAPAAAPTTTSKGIEMPSTDAPSTTGLPATPTFGGSAGKAAPKTYEATGPTPGKHTAPKGISVGKPAAAGTQLPSQMNSGPKWIEDTGNGPQADHTFGLTLHDVGQGLATAAGAPTDKDYADTDKRSLQKDTSGLRVGKGAPPVPAPRVGTTAPAPREQEFSTGRQAFTGMEMPRAPAPAPMPKKKMFGTALASNDEPAKM